MRMPQSSAGGACRRWEGLAQMDASLDGILPNKGGRRRPDVRLTPKRRLRISSKQQASAPPGSSPRPVVQFNWQEKRVPQVMTARLEEG